MIDCYKIFLLTRSPTMVISLLLSQDDKFSIDVNVIFIDIKSINIHGITPITTWFLTLCSAFRGQLAKAQLPFIILFTILFKNYSQRVTVDLNAFIFLDIIEIYMFIPSKRSFVLDLRLCFYGFIIHLEASRDQ